MAAGRSTTRVVGDIVIPMTVLEELDAAKKGTSETSRNARQVTLIQWEHLAVVSALLGREITPADLRRNIAVSGINLFSLKGRRFNTSGLFPLGLGGGDALGLLLAGVDALIS